MEGGRRKWGDGSPKGTGGRETCVGGGFGEEEQRVGGLVGGAHTLDECRRAALAQARWPRGARCAWLAGPRWRGALGRGGPRGAGREVGRREAWQLGRGTGGRLKGGGCAGGGAGPGRGAWGWARGAGSVGRKEGEAGG
jgi:hypothetical protein